MEERKTYYICYHNGTKEDQRLRFQIPFFKSITDVIFTPSFFDGGLSDHGKGVPDEIIRDLSIIKMVIKKREKEEEKNRLQ